MAKDFPAISTVDKYARRWKDIILAMSYSLNDIYNMNIYFKVVEVQIQALEYIP
jgi:hypothetical protein